MIIGISGHKQSGKDSVAKIIQSIISGDHLKGTLSVIKNNYDIPDSGWQIVKFADKLKDIVCLIIGCTREQLEDEEFKNTPLGEEWKNYSYNIAEGKTEFDEGEPSVIHEYFITPRMLLQRIGTDVCRNIHPNMWVNATMREYKAIDRRTFQDPDDSNIIMPNWIISDVRFPNEYDAIKERNGIVIRVNRLFSGQTKQLTDTIRTGNVSTTAVEIDHSDPHPSETALDNHDFDYTIDNNGTIDDLIVKVKDILVKEKMI